MEKYWFQTKIEHLHAVKRLSLLCCFVFLPAFLLFISYPAVADDQSPVSSGRGLVPQQEFIPSSQPHEELIEKTLGLTTPEQLIQRYLEGTENLRNAVVRERRGQGSKKLIRRYKELLTKQAKDLMTSVREISFNFEDSLKECDISRAERWTDQWRQIRAQRDKINQAKLNIAEIEKYEPYLQTQIGNTDGKFAFLHVVQMLDGEGNLLKNLENKIATAKKAREKSEQLNTQAKQAYRQARQQENLGDIEGARASYQDAEQKLQKGVDTLGDDLCIDNQNTLENNIVKVQQRLAGLSSLKGKITDSSGSQDSLGSRSQSDSTSTSGSSGNTVTRAAINSDESNLYDQWMRETQGGTKIEQQTDDWYPEDEQYWDKPADGATGDNLESDRCAAFKKSFLQVFSQKDYDTARILIARNKDCAYAEDAMLNVNIAEPFTRYFAPALNRSMDQYFQQKQLETRRKRREQRNTTPTTTQNQQHVIQQKSMQAGKPTAPAVTCDQLNAQLLAACQQNRMGSVQHLEARWNELGCQMSAALSACGDRYIDSQIGPMLVPLKKLK